jgi:hypothetical protein
VQKRAHLVARERLQSRQRAGDGPLGRQDRERGG